MTQPRKIVTLALFVGAVLLLPGRAAAQSGTVTDDGFISSNATTEKANLGGYGPSIIVAGSTATVGTAQVGQTKGFIKFQLQSSLPQLSPTVAAADVVKATLKLFISPSCSPTGSIAIYPVTSAWTETTLNATTPPALASTPFATGIQVGQPDSFVVVDLTSLVKEWLDGPGNGGITNDGIALLAETSTTNVAFDSKDSVFTSHEPRLEIILANSGPAGAAATIQVGSTTTLGPTGQAAVTNSGTSSAAILNFAIPQGQPGATGQTGPAGQAATINVGTVLPVPYNAAPAVMNGGTANAAVLNFLIPQGQPGAPGATGPQGPVGINNKGPWSSAVSYSPNDAVFDSASFWLATAANNNSEPSPTNTNWQLLAGGIVNRGVWNAANGYNLNDVVTDAGSSWLATAPTSANTATPSTSCEPTQAACASDWQLLAQQGAQGPQGQTGPQGPKGDQGLQGFMGLQGPPGVPPPNVAVTNANNNFAAPQTVGGSVSITGAGNGLVFPDGTLQTTAATSNGGGTCTPPFEVSSSSPITPVGYTPFSQITAGNLWFTMAPMPTARGALAAVTANGKIYAIGGSSSTGPVNTVEVYDPTTNTWGTAAPMPTARTYLAATILNGKIYAIGGADSTLKAFNVVEVYDPATNTWTNAAPMPTARFLLGAAAVNGKIYAIGDSIFAGINEVYDPLTDTWSAAPAVPFTVFGAATAALNGKIYEIGGSDGTQDISIVQVYDPSTKTWSNAPPMKDFAALQGATSVNGKIYAIGGDFSPTDLQVYDSAANAWSLGPSMPTPRGNLAVAAANGLIYAIGGLAPNQTILNPTEQYSPSVTIYTFIKN